MAGISLGAGSGVVEPAVSVVVLERADEAGVCGAEVAGALVVEAVGGGAGVVGVSASLAQAEIATVPAMSNRPNVSDFLRNWRDSDRSTAEKVVQTIRNNGLKLLKRSSCCGNHGEPGC